MRHVCWFIEEPRLAGTAQCCISAPQPVLVQLQGSPVKCFLNEVDDFFLLSLIPAFSFLLSPLNAPSFHNTKITCPGEQEGMS